MSLNLSNYEQADYVDPLTTPPLEPAAFDSPRFMRAIAFGLVGAVLGAIIYAAFITITGIQIGYLAIGIAYLAAKAMMMGSNERGGNVYQVSALVLTCVSVAMGNAMMILWALHKDMAAPLSVLNVFRLLPLGFEEPFLEFKDSAGSALIGLFILFIGLRAAWRMTSGIPGAVRHPFRR